MIKQDDRKAVLMKLVFLITGAAAIFAYAYFVIEPELIYHGQGRMISYEHFEIGWEFFVDSVVTVSGPMHYLSGLLTHLFYYPLAGSAIIAGLWTILCMLSYKIVQRSKFLRKIPATAFIPAFLMLVGYNRFQNHTTAFLSVIAAVAVFLLYDKTKKQDFPTKATVFIVLFFFLFWLSGQACFLFSVLCALSQDKIRTAVFFLLFAFAFFWACNDLLIIKLPFSQLETSTRFSGDRYMSYSYYLCVLAIAAAVKSLSHEPNFTSGEKSNKTMARKHNRFAAVSLLIVNILILSTVSYSSLVPSFFKDIKHLLKVGDYSVREQWDEVIAYCKKNPVHSKRYFQLHDINYALFKKGRLLEDLFQFKQNSRSLLLIIDDNSPLKRYRCAKTMYELGHVGMAQKIAVDLQVLNGNEPEILHRLALIYLAKDNPATAMHYLNKLEKNIIYKDRAEQILNLIDGGKYLSPLAGSVVTDDRVAFTLKMEIFFGDLLRKNPQNKMAFDYMMALFLLTKQGDKMVKHVPLMQEFGYKELPLAIRQGLIIHKLVKGDKFDISGYDISEAEIKSAVDFFRATKSPSLRYNAEIINQNKNSYYYYYVFTEFD
jgi:hypothetical protein